MLSYFKKTTLAVLILSTLLTSGCSLLKKQSDVYPAPAPIISPNVYESYNISREFAGPTDSLLPSVYSNKPNAAILMMRGNTLNATVCESYKQLPSTGELEAQGIPREDQLITRLPVLDKEKVNHISGGNCQPLLDFYDYDRAENELRKALGNKTFEGIFDKDLNQRGPFIAIYSPMSTNPVLLDLGQLSSEELELVLNNWDALFSKALGEENKLSNNFDDQNVPKKIAEEIVDNSKLNQDIKEKINLYTRLAICVGMVVGEILFPYPLWDIAQQLFCDKYKS